MSLHRCRPGYSGRCRFRFGRPWEPRFIPGVNVSTQRRGSCRDKGPDVESGPASVTLVFTGFSVLLAGIWAWTLVGAKTAVTWRVVPEPLATVFSRFLISQGLAPRLPLLAWSPRRLVPWAFLDLIVLTGLYVVAGAALHKSGLIATGKMEAMTLVQKQ